MPYAPNRLRDVADELAHCVLRLKNAFDDVDRLVDACPWTGPAADDLAAALHTCRGGIFWAQAELLTDIHALGLEAATAAEHARPLRS